MSLINDALKKAQKQRTGEAPSLGSMPSVGGQSAASISRSGKSGGNPLLVPVGIGAAVLLVAVGGYFAFRSSPTASPAPAKPAVASTQPAVPASPAASSSTPSSPLPAPTSAPTSSAAPAFTLQVAPKVDPVVPKAELSTPVPTAPAPATKAPPVAATPALKLEPRAMTFIDNIKVAGVRASATDSKVLMNDRVYRVGDTVDHEMGLKLVGITSSSLTFEDEHGGRYTRNL